MTEAEYSHYLIQSLRGNGAVASSSKATDPNNNFDFGFKSSNDPFVDDSSRNDMAVNADLDLNKNNNVEVLFIEIIANLY